MIRAVYGIAHVTLTENNIPARGVVLIIFSVFWTWGSVSQGHGLRAPCWPWRGQALIPRLSSRPPPCSVPSWLISQICPNSEILGVKTGVIPPTGILQFNHKLSDKNVYFFSGAITLLNVLFVRAKGWKWPNLPMGCSWINCGKSNSRVPGCCEKWWISWRTNMGWLPAYAAKWGKAPQSAD